VRLTRRELFEIAGGLAFAAPAAAWTDAPSLEDTARRAADVIRGYSAEGLHRTATAVDRRSADRLLELARSTGASPALEPFELSRVDPVANFLEIDGVRIDGLPMFDGGFTGATGVFGPLRSIDERSASLSGERSDVAFAQTSPNGEAALHRARVASRHRAIVAVTVGARPGLCPVNAPSFTKPFGPPVIQVGSEHLSAVQEAAARSRPVRVVARVNRQRATAFNVVATVAGTRRDLAPVCVMTPRSGWHANASERGGGLACWLDVLRAVASARAARDVKFIASSGHELGHLGLRAYLERNTGLAGRALAWVHLGANIGASTGDTRMTPSDDELSAAALRALQPYGLETIARAPAEQVAGEAATIREEHGRFISFIGQNAWFHNPRDLWPDAVDIQVVARFARGVADLTVALAQRV
jgi:hypothetical protein